MREIFKIFISLQATNSKIIKADIIKQNKDNALFTDTLKFLLDNNITTGISMKKLTKQLPILGDLLNRLSDWYDVMNYLTSHNTGKHEDIIMIQDFLSRQSESDRPWYEKLITKTLKLGFDSKTANAVIPGLIPVWEIQQAYPLAKYRLKPNEPIALSQKLNGIHGTAIGGKMISRQGKEIGGFSHILNELKALGMERWFVDGELIRKNIDNVPDEENFRLTCGICNSDAEDKSEIEFIIYEIMPEDEFENGCPLKYFDRLDRLEKFESKKLGDSNYIHVVDRYYRGTDHLQIQKWLDYTDSKGLEGCMLNRDTLYQRKRNNGILKVKSWLHCDIRVTGVEVGKGKYANTTGKLICNYKGNVIGISGMSDEERDMFWKSPKDIIGKIITVKYKQESQDKNGKKSLNFATFVCVRFDKDEESYN